MYRLNVQGEELQLLAERAVYWQSAKTLIVADLHWGKTGHFRKNGVAIPASTQLTDELLLAELIQHTATERLIIAGDFFHSKENNETLSFKHWRDAHPNLEIILVMGNHDILPKERYKEWGVTVYEEVIDLGPFMISHDELPEPKKFYLHGHVHPKCLVKGKTRFSVSLPCFCVGNNRMILPAFGKFTGGKKIAQPDFNEIYIVADNEVIRWK